MPCKKHPQAKSRKNPVSGSPTRKATGNLMSARIQTLLLTALLAAVPSIQAQPTRQELQTAIDIINRKPSARFGSNTASHRVSLENGHVVFDVVINPESHSQPKPLPIDLLPLLQSNLSDLNLGFLCGSREAWQLSDLSGVIMRYRLTDRRNDVITATLPKGYCATHSTIHPQTESEKMEVAANIAATTNQQLPLKLNEQLTLTRVAVDTKNPTIHRYFIITDPSIIGSNLSAFRTFLQQSLENATCTDRTDAENNRHFATHEHFTFANRPGSVDVVIPQDFCANRR